MAKAARAADYRCLGNRIDAPAVFGTGLLALDVIFSADSSRDPIFAAGGTCGNVLTALSYLGWQAYPIARLNGDRASEMVRADLDRWHVSLEFAALTPSGETPIVVQRNKWLRDGTPSHRFLLACPTCGSWYPPFRPITASAANEVVEAVAGTAPSGFAPRVFFFDRVSRGALVLAEALASQGAMVVFEPVGVGDPKLFEEALAVAHVLKYSHQRLRGLRARTRLRNHTLLEVETLGGQGLRFRTRATASGKWQTLDAVSAPRVLDTAGAGDWCTAGLVSMIAEEGAASLESAGEEEITEALRFGQAAAALACGYDGARGVMNAFDPKAFVEAACCLLKNPGRTTDAVLRDWTDETGRKPRNPGSGASTTDEVRTICAACP